MKAVQYDSENGWTNWIKILKSLKTVIPSVTSEVERFFNDFAENSDLMELTNDELAAYVDINYKVDKSLVSFIKNTDKSQLSIDNYRQELNDVRKSTDKLGDGLKKLSATLLSMAAMWLIGEGIQLVYENIIKGQEKLISKGEEAKETIKSLQNELKSTGDTLDDIKDDYAKLSKGVDAFGNNVSLTTEEYKKYHQVTNQIADMFPDLVQGYDDEGNAILRVKGNVEDLTKAYAEQKQAYKDALVTASADVFKGFNAKVNPADKVFGQIQQWFGGGSLTGKKDALQNFLDTATSSGGKLWASSNSDLIKALHEAGIEVETYEKNLKMSIEDTDKAREIIEAKIRQYNREISTEVAGIKPTIQALVEDSKSYNDLNDTGRKMASSIIQGFDDEFYVNHPGQDAVDYISENVVEVLKKTENYNVGKEFDELLTLQAQFKNGEVSLSEYTKAVNKFKSELGDFDDNTRKVIEVVFEPKTTDGYSVDNLNDILTRIFSSNGQLKNAKLDINIAKYVMGLSPEIRDALFEGLESGEIDVSATMAGMKKAVEQIKKAVDSAVESEKPFLTLKDGTTYTQEAFDELFNIGTSSNPFDDLIDSAEEFTKALKSVRSEISVVDDALKEQNKDGKISAETAAKLVETNQDFGKALEYTKNGIKLKTTALKDELKAYIDILTAQYEKQKTDAQEIIDTNNAAIAHERLALALTLQTTARKSDIVGPMPVATEDLTSDEIAKLEKANEEQKQIQKDSQAQLDLLQGMIAEINSPDFGINKSSSTSTAKTKSYEKNTNTYNWADAWLQTQQNNVDRIETEYEKINKQLAKAIELGDEELIWELSDKAIAKSEELQELRASKAIEGRDRYSKIMNQIWDIAPELAGRSIDEISEEDILKVNQILDDIVEKEKRIAVDMYNANNDIVDANQTAIDAAEDRRKLWDTLIKNAQEYDKAFGNAGFTTEAEKEMLTQLEEFEKGGNVNLKLRPTIDAKLLQDVGWEAAEGIATVFTNTFSDETETIAMNFTPIIANPETGEYIGVLSPEELQRYAEGVIAGTRTDDLNLQIGTQFVGEDAIDQAVEAAETIHELHEQLFVDNNKTRGTFGDGWAEDVDNIIETTKRTFEAINDIFDKELDKQQREIDKIDFQIDLIDESDAGRYTKQMDLIAQKSQINAEMAAKVADQIDQIKEEFGDSLVPADEYNERMQELEDQYNDCIKSGKEFEDTLKDIAQEQIDAVVSVENEVMSYLEDYMSMVEDNAQKEIDAAEKSADAKKKALDKAKDALKDYQDQLEKQWKAENERDARREKLDERNEKSTERAKALTAAATGDLEALSKVQDLDKEIADIDKELQEDIIEDIRDSLKDFIDGQIDALDKQADKLDDQLDTMKEQLDEAKKTNEELLKGESGYALVHALMAGESVKLNGKDVDYSTIRSAVDTENGNAFSYGYESETAEWQKNLSESLASVANLTALNELAEGKFTLENGTIVLGDGRIYDGNISSPSGDEQSSKLIPLTTEAVLNAIGLKSGENLSGYLTAIGENLTRNMGLLDAVSQSQKDLANYVTAEPKEVNLNFDSLIRVMGNLTEDVEPKIRKIVAEMATGTVLADVAKGISAKAVGLGSRWL